MTIRQATINDLNQLSVLFAQYRVFYEQPFEPDEANLFLKERLSKEESIVFIAIENDQYAGFIQLYPSFSSVGMKKIWILNDLFVSADYRKKGIGQLLINHVMAYLRQQAEGRLFYQQHMTISPHKSYMKNLALPDPIFIITK